MSVSIRQLVDANVDSIGLSWLAGRSGGDRLLGVSSVEPADLVG